MGGVGVDGGAESLFAQLGEDARGLRRVMAAQVGEEDVAEGGVADARGFVAGLVAALFEPPANLLRRPHRLPVPLREGEVLGEVVEGGGVGKPLAGMHPGRVAGEEGPPADAVAGEVAAVGVAVLGAVDVLAVAVEPVLGHAARLDGVAKGAGGGHRVIAQGESQQEESAPALHGLGGGLLTIAVAVAHAAREGMARPGVEGAEEGEERVGALPVGVVLRDELQHRAVFAREITIHEAEERAGIGEIAVVEMVVVEGLGIVARVDADESAPLGDEGEEARLVARPVGEPVHEDLAEAVSGTCEGGVVARFARGHHREGHLEQPLAAPVGVMAEGAALGVVGDKRLEENGVVRRCLGVVGLRDLRGWPVRYDSGEGIDDFQRVAGGDMLPAARRLPDESVEALEVLPRLLEVVRLEALKGWRRCAASAKVLGFDAPCCSDLRLGRVIVPVDAGLTDNCRSVGSESFVGILGGEKADGDPAAVTLAAAPDAVEVVADGEDFAAVVLASLFDKRAALADVGGNEKVHAPRLDPGEGRAVDECGADLPIAVLEHDFDVPVMPVVHKGGRRCEGPGAGSEDAERRTLAHLRAVVGPVLGEGYADAASTNAHLGGIAPEIAGPLRDEGVGPPVVGRKGLARIARRHVERARLHEGALVALAAFGLAREAKRLKSGDGPATARHRFLGERRDGDQADENCRGGFHRGGSLFRKSELAATGGG